ncbi:MAG: hypothetical protein ACKVZH_10985 [Blastocatellia bacterium]
MTVLAGLCIFMTVVLGIMAAMALASRGIAEDNRQQAEAETETKKEDQ